MNTRMMFVRVVAGESNWAQRYVWSLARGWTQGGMDGDFAGKYAAKAVGGIIL